MILDSEIQRKVLIDALEAATIQGKMARELVKLLDILEKAEITDKENRHR